MGVEEVRRRTAARKSRAENQTYPEHAGKGSLVVSLQPRRGAAASCVHGTDLSGPERVAAGLDHVRLWKRCGHPDRPLGENVCPCSGCGERCRGYEPDG